MRSAFVAMPVSDNLASDGRFRPERKAFFEPLIHVLEELGLKVMSAGTNEQWGAVKLAVGKFTKYDLDSIATADLLIVVTNERLNRDMYLETGLARGRGIPAIFLMPASTKLTYMALGMEELGDIEVYRYDAAADAPQILREAVVKLLANP